MTKRLANEVKETAAAQTKLKAFHEVAGFASCSFEDYRANIGGLLGIRSAVIDSLYRCGLIWARDGQVGLSASI